MENRHDMDHSRNTINLPRPSAKNRDRRRIMMSVPEDERGLKIQEYREKTALSRVCVWCGNDQLKLRAVCMFCHTCQYCGLLPMNTHRCDRCGNSDPDYVRQSRVVVVSAEKPPEAPEIQKANARRVSAQTRSRGPKTAE